jgi:hypothetical protein
MFIVAGKHFAVLLDDTTAAQLKARSSFENRAVDEIVADAIREYSAAHPISREALLAIVRDIAREDAALLKALAEA